MTEMDLWDKFKFVFSDVSFSFLVFHFFFYSQYFSLIKGL